MNNKSVEIEKDEIVLTADTQRPVIQSCCGATKQQTCCEASAKASCCGSTASTGSCGCK